jgi:hypothetical protein
VFSSIKCSVVPYFVKHLSDKKITFLQTELQLAEEEE